MLHQFYQNFPKNHEKNIQTIPQLENSQLYTKNGMMKRSDLGWEAVQLASYVTQKISDDYTQNKSILEKFRMEAEQNRKSLKNRHAFQSNHQVPTNYNLQVKPDYHLGSIGSVILPNINSNPSYTQSENKETVFCKRENPTEETPYYRNVGVNTNKEYEKYFIRKFIKLQNKYDVLKNKYKMEKELRKREQNLSLYKYKDSLREVRTNSQVMEIENDLMNISMKLETSNRLLNEELTNIEKERLDTLRKNLCYEKINRELTSREKEYNVISPRKERSYTMSNKTDIDELCEKWSVSCEKNNPEFMTPVKERRKKPKILYSEPREKTRYFSLSFRE